MSESLSGIGSYVKQNPDVAMRIGGMFLPASLRAPLSAVAGVTELSKLPERQKAYMGAYEASRAKTTPSDLPNPDEAGLSFPPAGTMGGTMTDEQKKIMMGGAPRDQGKITEGTIGDVQKARQVAVLQREKEWADMQKLIPPSPGPQPLSAFGSTKGIMAPKPGPSMEELVRLLMNQQRQQKGGF